MVSVDFVNRVDFMEAGYSQRKIVFKNDDLGRYKAHYLNRICINYVREDLGNHTHPASS